MARCFTSASISGFATILTVPGKSGTTGHVRNAHIQCAALFRQGFLKRGVGRELAHPSRGEHQVPHLVVCIWNDGTAAVFPGRKGTCARLDLPAAARR
jgi:hypothetical protein